MNVEEIRALRVAEYERTKNMSREEIVEESNKRAEVLWKQIEEMKKENARV